MYILFATGTLKRLRKKTARLAKDLEQPQDIGEHHRLRSFRPPKMCWQSLILYMMIRQQFHGS